MPPAIVVDRVSQLFPGANGAPDALALEDVSLEVNRGEFVCLLGPSGCGKSTLLNVIGGLLVPSSGTVTVGETTVRGPLPRDVAFIFQESTLLPWYTVLENFRVSLEFQGRTEGWREHSLTALAEVGMEGFAQFYPSQLSIGMKQRINMARGIALGTGILLMDEPFAALDEQTRLVLGEDLSVLLARTGKTIVFVTHSLSEAVLLADRIVVMTARPGKIKSIINVGEPHPRSPDFMLQPHFSEVRNRVLRACCATRSSIRWMRCARRAMLAPANAELRLTALVRTIQVAVIAALFAVWVGLTSTHAVNALFLPAPLAVLRRLEHLVVTAGFWGAVGVTAFSTAIAYSIASIAGVTLGFFVGRSPTLTAAYRPILSGMFAIPLTLFFPLFVVMFGLGPSSKIAFGALYAFFPIALNTIAGFSGIDRLFLRAAQSHKVRRACRCYATSSCRVRGRSC